jgi:hypothetical protein
VEKKIFYCRFLWIGFLFAFSSVQKAPTPYQPGGQATPTEGQFCFLPCSSTSAGLSINFTIISFFIFLPNFFITN